MADPDMQDDELLLDTPLDEDGEDAGNDAGACDDDEIVLEGEEDIPADETPLQKKLRETAREALRRASAAEKRNAELEAAQNAPVEVGEMPTLESCEYDEQRFDAAYQAWTGRKSAADRRAASAEAAERTRLKTINDLDVTYRTSATRMAPASQAVFEQADKEFRDLFGDDAPTALAGYFKEPAKLVVALHKYPSRRQTILDEPDNMKKLLLLKEVELAIKSSGARRQAPPPESETIQRGSAPLSATTDKHLQRLEQEAARTGDRSKLIEYKAKKRAA